LRHEYAWSDARIHALAQAGASAFNAWRTHADIIGPMHVLREVVGAEFVDGQRNRPKEGGGDGRP
jgi:hypothetical protein